MAASVVSSVATPAAQSENPRIETNSPINTTTPYSAQTAISSGTFRSREKIASVSATASVTTREPSFDFGIRNESAYAIIGAHARDHPRRRRRAADPVDALRTVRPGGPHDRRSRHGEGRPGAFRAWNRS